MQGGVCGNISHPNQELDVTISTYINHLWHYKTRGDKVQGVKAYISVIIVESCHHNKIMNYKIIKHQKVVKPSFIPQNTDVTVYATRLWRQNLRYQNMEPQNCETFILVQEYEAVIYSTRLLSHHPHHRIMMLSTTPRDYESLIFTTELWNPSSLSLQYEATRLRHHRPYHKIIKSSSTLLLCCHYSYHVLMK